MCWLCETQVHSLAGGDAPGRLDKGQYKQLERVLAVKNNPELRVFFLTVSNWAFNFIMKIRKERRCIKDKLNSHGEINAERYFLTEFEMRTKSWSVLISRSGTHVEGRGHV